MIGSPNNTATLQLLVALFLPLMALLVYVAFELKAVRQEQEDLRSSVTELDGRVLDNFQMISQDRSVFFSAEADMQDEEKSGESSTKESDSLPVLQ